MFVDEPVAVHCHLSRGGFSSERVIRISTADGKTFVGVAPPEYCYTPQGVRIGPDRPGAGEHLPGLVAARRLDTEGNGTVLVSVPDGNVLVVNPELVTRRPVQLGGFFGGVSDTPAE
jgi:hypothetical protein